MQMKSKATATTARTDRGMVVTLSARWLFIAQRLSHGLSLSRSRHAGGHSEPVFSDARNITGGLAVWSTVHQQPQGSVSAVNLKPAVAESQITNARSAVAMWRRAVACMDQARRDSSIPRHYLHETEALLRELQDDRLTAAAMPSGRGTKWAAGRAPAAIPVERPRA